jgi:hypothetical protein
MLKIWRRKCFPRRIEVHLGTLTAIKPLPLQIGLEMKAKASICISEDETLVNLWKLQKEESRSW